MSKLYVTITNLEFEDMTPEEVETKVFALMKVFEDHMGERTQAIATDHPHSVILEDLKKYDSPIVTKEVRDQ